MKRRDFLATAATTALLSAALPAFGRISGRGSLLVVELVGGHDGLNAIVPYADPNYLRLRPTLGIRDSLAISATTGLHPGLQSLKPIFDAGRLAIVQNVSYPNPSLSHFRSRDIWHSARPEGSATSGWLARYLKGINGSTADAVFLGEEYPLALLGEGGERYLQYSPNLLATATDALSKAVQDAYAIAQPQPLAEKVRLAVLEDQKAIAQIVGDLSRQSGAGYANTAIGNQFALAGRLLESRPQLVYLTISGWDTHVNQLQRQGDLLAQVGSGLSALDRNLQAKGLGREVLTLVFSEFGRRPAQNGTGGTDHGTTGPVLVMGALRGGLYGGTPALDSLVDGNLPVQVDFRSIYAEILQSWALVNPTSAIAANVPLLGFLS